MKSIIFILLLFLTGCFPSKSSNAIEQLGEQVLKKKEGIEIRLIPIQEQKTTKNDQLKRNFYEAYIADRNSK